MARRKSVEVSQEVKNNETVLKNENGDVLIAVNDSQVAAFKKFGFEEVEVTEVVVDEELE